MSDTAQQFDLKKILTGGQLPALPQSAIRVLDLSKDPKNGPAEFAAPIEADPGLAGQVLRFVNSSYFGFSREISSVQLAITLVGIRTVKNFTLWSAVFSLMPNPKCGPFELQSLWQDSLRRAIFARAVAKLLKLKDAEATFAAALLQDMAVPLLAKEFSEIYLEMLEARDGGAVRLSELEQQRFGWTHADAAAMMCESWNLPEDLSVLIRHHTQLDDGVLTSKESASQVGVSLSALLPATADETWAERETFVAAYEKAGLDKLQPIAQLLADVDEAFVEFAPVLKMSSPGQTLHERFEQDAVAAS